LEIFFEGEDEAITSCQAQVRMMATNSSSG